MGSLLLNDIIITLFSGAVRFDREVYEELCRELYDYYDTQSRTGTSYRLTNPRGGSCVIDSRHVRLTDFFGGAQPETIVRPLAQVARRALAVFGDPEPDAYDIQMSARLPQKELDHGRRINFLSSEEYIAARFLQDVDLGPLQGTGTGVGLRFLYQRAGVNHDLRVEPYFKDRTFLFLDLGIQYPEGNTGGSLEERLVEDVRYFEQNVVEFIRWRAATGEGAL